MSNTFAEVHKWQRSRWSSPDRVPVTRLQASEVLDMRMTVQGRRADRTVVNIAAVRADAPDTIVLNDVEIDGSSPGRSTKRLIEARSVLGLGVTLKDVKFLKDISILALAKTAEHGYILLRLPARLLDEWRGSETPSSSHQEIIAKFTVHAFSKTDHFVPARLIVNDEQDRKHILIIDRQNRAWRILDLDHRSNASGMPLKGFDGSGTDEDAGVDEEETMVVD